MKYLYLLKETKGDISSVLSKRNYIQQPMLSVISFLRISFLDITSLGSLF